MLLFVFCSPSQAVRLCAKFQTTCVFLLFCKVIAWLFQFSDITFEMLLLRFQLIYFINNLFAFPAHFFLLFSSSLLLQTSIYLCRAEAAENINFLDMSILSIPHALCTRLHVCINHCAVTDFSCRFLTSICRFTNKQRSTDACLWATSSRSFTITHTNR